MPVVNTQSTQSTNPTQAALVQRDPNRAVQQGAAVGNCKSTDSTPAPTPSLRRAFCFDLAKKDAQIVPQPPPSNTGWSPRPRDPVLIELGEIEIGSHLELISLTDQPDATFESDCVRRLDFTGYDVGNRIGTVVLGPEEMANAGFQPGERVVVRQVDKNGNASDAIFIHLDPNGWANQQVRQSDDAGNQVTLRGAKLIEKNVTLQSFSYTKEEVDVANELRNGTETRNFIYRVLRRTSFNLEECKQLVVRTDIPAKAKETLDKLLANNNAMFGAR